MIEFRNVTKTYDNGAKALKGVSMKIEGRRIRLPGGTVRFR